MSVWRIQPITTILVTALLSALGLWGALGAFGLVMLVGAVFPSLNLLDYWISFVSRSRHRTTLYPRRFATGMGGSMLLAAAVCGMSGLVGAAWTFSLLTIGAAGLLAISKFCLGCWIYNAFVAPWAERKQRAAS